MIYIVVLGKDLTLKTGGRINTQRIRKGVELFHSLPQDASQKRLVLSGHSKSGKGRSEAVFMKRIALQLGVPLSSLVIERKSRDTIENARNTHALIGNVPITLVTSPNHGQRAKKTFSQWFDTIHLRLSR